MDKDVAVAIAQAARRARASLGLTQAQVAEQLGVCLDFYTRIERCRASPSLKTLLRMRSVLGVSADTLLGLDDVSRIAPATVPLVRSEDPPALRRLGRALRDARPGTVRVVGQLLRVLDEPRASQKRTGGRTRERPAADD